MLLIFGIRKELAGDGFGSRVRDLLVGWWCGRSGVLAQTWHAIGRIKDVEEISLLTTAKGSKGIRAGVVVLTAFDVGSGLLRFGKMVDACLMSSLS